MRTVSNLLNLEGRVYVYLKSENIAKLFLANTEVEGFTFGDGIKPTERNHSDIYALNDDWTINFVGFVGHMAFHRPADHLTRVDYGKYLSGSEDYIIQS